MKERRHAKKQRLNWETRPNQAKTKIPTKNPTQPKTPQPQEAFAASETSETAFREVARLSSLWKTEVTFEGLESEPRNDSNGFLIRESIGEICREVVQIFNCPGLLDENGKANSEVLDYLVDNFAADNFSRQYVRCEDSHAAAVLAFDIPTHLADKIPVSFVIGNHVPFVIHFLAPLMK